jgi:hypothetical protein
MFVSQSCGMSDSGLKTKIRRLVRDHLASEGFTLLRPRVPERLLVGLRQSLEFQPGISHLAGRFTINVRWTFTLAAPYEGAAHGRRRIGELAGGADTWFSREPAQLDEDFARATALILHVALPYLNRYASVESITSSYERGELTAKHAFGPDRGWQLFHLGFCYAFLGRTTAAVTSFQSLIQDHSSGPWDWMQERKTDAEQKVALLASGARSL